MSSIRTTWPVGLVLLLAIGLVLAPVGTEAKPKKKDTSTTTTVVDKTLGGIDPTNIAIVDDDLLAMSIVTDLQLNASVAATRATGRGVVVAVLDGGFNLDHPDLAGRLSPYAYDAIDDDADPTDLGNGIDDDRDGVTDRGVGHGTFVAGMVLEAAPEATILPVRIRDDEGYGTNDQLEAGIRFAVAMGADVINLSIHPGQARKSGLRAIDRAGKAGVLIVVAAGNESASELNDLAWNWYTLPVGAVDSTNRIADFSSYSYDAVARMVFAPGVDLYGPIGSPTDDARGYWSGTSFAAGFVSGAAALVRELRPDLGLDSWRGVLETSTVPVLDATDAVHPHAGCVDLENVIQNAQVAVD